jgi:hypothetical protein
MTSFVRVCICATAMGILVNSYFLDVKINVNSGSE